MMNKVSKLIKRNGPYYRCSECMMEQKDLCAGAGYCWWCGAAFSNYTEILFLEYKESNT